MGNGLLVRSLSEKVFPFSDGELGRRGSGRYNPDRKIHFGDVFEIGERGASQYIQDGLVELVVDEEPAMEAADSAGSYGADQILFYVDGALAGPQSAGPSSPPRPADEAARAALVHLLAVYGDRFELRVGGVSLLKPDPIIGRVRLPARPIEPSPLENVASVDPKMPWYSSGQRLDAPAAPPPPPPNPGYPNRTPSMGEMQDALRGEVVK